jgi:hypothetical protein
MRQVALSTLEFHGYDRVLSCFVARACRILIESAGDSQGAANQIQVVVQTEADGDGEALFDGFARARDEACCSR